MLAECGVVRGAKQRRDTVAPEIVAETVSDMVMEARFVSNVKMYQPRFVVVLHPSDFDLVELNKLQVETVPKVGDLAHRLREAQNRLVGLVASLNNAIDDVVKRAAVDQHLQE